MADVGRERPRYRVGPLCIGCASRHHHDGPGQVGGAPGGHALPLELRRRARRSRPTIGASAACPEVTPYHWGFDGAPGGHALPLGLRRRARRSRPTIGASAARPEVTPYHWSFGGVPGGHALPLEQPLKGAGLNSARHSDGTRTRWHPGGRHLAILRPDETTRRLCPGARY